MVDLIPIDLNRADAPKPEEGSAPPEKLVKGPFTNKAWNFDSREENRLHSGIWESTPGAAHITYDEWEFCHIISGRAIISNEAGTKWEVKAGDAFIIPPGFKGIWETVETLRKHYVILLPKAG